jgi:hypothetical protein
MSAEPPTEPASSPSAVQSAAVSPAGILRTIASTIYRIGLFLFILIAIGAAIALSVKSYKDFRGDFGAIGGVIAVIAMWVGIVAFDIYRRSKKT